MRREAAKLDQAGLLRMERQRKRLKPRAHHVEKPTRVALSLEPDHDVIRIARDDHNAGGLAPSPTFGPEVEDLVQIDVGEQRRNHRSLPRPPITGSHDSVFEHPRLEPFLDQANDAPVADPVLQKAYQPFLTDRIEEPLNIGVHNPAHLRAADPSHQRIQRIVLAALGPESIREPEEFLLVNLVQYGSSRSLDDFVLERRHGERTLSSIRLRYVPATGWLRPIRSPMNAGMQVREISLKIGLVVLPFHAVHSCGRIALEREKRQPEQVNR